MPLSIDRDYAGTLNTGVIVICTEIALMESRDFDRAVVAASTLMPPLNPKSKHAIARYCGAIARMLTEAIETICQVMLAQGNNDGILEAL